MRSIRWSVALASAVLAGCFASKPTEVIITPTAYRVGEVQSEIATPVVDEVVRMKPGKVLILSCRETHPLRISQFERELTARHPSEVTMVLLDKGCPSI